ncbi:PAS domain-containing sensor histidine kinase [Algihabitans albus]|uniref:PAS domain-containing sensor histidine kinase n=1 Tax=Algihabitans albus TaxID=2164067 RepID=UPI000E5C74B1|nr:ATP-binding protein [Algihabitans albus]
MLLSFDNIELKRLLDSISAPTFVVDVLENGVFRYAAFNRYNEERCGLSHEEATGRRFEDLLDPTLASHLEGRYLACIEAGTITEYDEELEVAGRRRIWSISLSPLFDDDGQVRRILGTANEVTVLRDQEAQLRDREAWLSTLVEGSLQGILIHRHNRPLFANTAFAQIYGYASPEEVLAEDDLTHLVAPEERQALAALSRSADETRNLDHFARVRGLTRTGCPLWIEFRARRVDWDGQPALQMTVVDVTERTRYEDQLIASKDRLEQQAESLVRLAGDLAKARTEAERARRASEQANRAKNQFLAAMSHELRTPLNAILGFSEIIAQEAFGTCSVPQYVEYSLDINESGRHLLELINDILDIAKIEAGKLEIHPEIVELDEVLEACRRLCAVKARERDIELQLDIAGGAQFVYADMRALKQILFNLLSNAIKFSKPGGQVDLAARRLRGDWLELSVTDEGIGIAGDQIGHVFNPFHQVDNRYNREAGGTGLGLALVKALAELHRGTVTLESELGQGTCVRVAFPPESFLKQSQGSPAGGIPVSEEGRAESDDPSTDPEAGDLQVGGLRGRSRRPV